MSADAETRDLQEWAAEVGATDDPREHDQYDPWADIPDHLTTDPAVRVSPGFEVDREKGLFYCTACHFRITRNTNNHNEYGHARDCPHHETYGGVE